MANDHKRDWFKFWVHFFFGALFGALLGLRLWGRSDYAMSTSVTPGVIFVGGGALVFGMIAGALSESGWDDDL